MSHNRTNKTLPGKNSNFKFSNKRGLSTVFIQDSVAACTKNVAVVELVVEIGDVTFRVRGDSKRFLGDKKRPADKHDPNIALGLATQRALAQVVKKMARQSDGLMLHYEKQAISKKKKAKTTKKGSK